MTDNARDRLLAQHRGNVTAMAEALHETTERLDIEVGGLSDEVDDMIRDNRALLDEFYKTRDLLEGE